MTRRELYRFVEDAVARASAAHVLAAGTHAMRALRDLPWAPSALANEFLDDAHFSLLLREDDALGRIYQAINARKLEAAYRATKRERRKFAANELSAVTQLFTPRWVVEFLLYNTLGRTWHQMHPDTKIAGKSDDPGPGKLRRAIDLRVIDPACGTMNFGLVAIELLDRMYREELDRAGRRGWPGEPSVRSASEIPGAIAQHNLFGIDIDPLALRLGAAAVEMKLRGAAPRNLWRSDALFDWNEHDGSFDVVVTNPPFLSARNLPSSAVARLKRAYPTAWRDSCAAFVERSLQFARPGGGRVGVLAMQSFMFTAAFQRFRALLNDAAAVEAIAHFGAGVFDVGNPGTLQTAAVIFRREPEASRRASQVVAAFRLVEAEDKPGALRARSPAFSPTQRQMTSSPRGAWIYWLDPRVQRLFSTFPKLAKIAPPRQGLATTDNARFVRYWWEVESSSSTGTKWFPYVKSGRFRRWYEAPRHRVDWEDDGAGIKRSIVERYPYLNGNWSWVAKNSAFYGREGVTYSYLTSGRFSARRLECGAIFDVAGSSLFPDDPLTMLAILNSSVARTLLAAINPTVNFQVGDLAELPVPRTTSNELREHVSRLIELRRALDRFDETASDFVAPMQWSGADEFWRQTTGEIRSLEQRIDQEVSGLYGLDPEAEAVVSPIPLDRVELARRWISFALRHLVEEVLQIRPIDRAIVSQLHERCGDEIDRAVGGIGRFLSDEFFGWHVRRYRQRPVIWVLGTSEKQFLVRHDRASRAVLGRVLRSIDERIPNGWEQCVDDGIAINLAPLHAFVRDQALARALRQVNKDLIQRRYDWSRTAQRLLNRAPNCGYAAAPRRSVQPGTRRPVGAART